MTETFESPIRSDVERYQGPIFVEFERMPSVDLVSLRLEKEGDASWIEHLSAATAKRKFTLREDWQLKLTGIEYAESLNGTVTIPHLETEKVDEKRRLVVFDGASVPYPWLISFLTIGLLRPLGMLLVSSIVHDFIYQHGYLLVRSEGEAAPRAVPVERHIADRLFRDMIITVNQVCVIGYIAWLAVRLGWFGVKFNGGLWAGRFPLAATSLLAALLGLFAYYVSSVDGSLMAALHEMAFVMVVAYTVFYVVTAVVKRWFIKEKVPQEDI